MSNLKWIHGSDPKTIIDRFSLDVGPKILHERR